MVTVLGFTKFDGNENKASRYKATLETITKFGGVPIDGSEEEVASSELDEDGRYDPRA